LVDGSAIAKEFYLSALVDREQGRVAFVVSQAGGMNIEEVAHETPEKITTVGIDPLAVYGMAQMVPQLARARRRGPLGAPNRILVETILGASATP
jgi:succinyl-CoA synthetase beta subunit